MKVRKRDVEISCQICMRQQMTYLELMLFVVGKQRSCNDDIYISDCYHFLFEVFVSNPSLNVINNICVLIKVVLIIKKVVLCRHFELGFFESWVLGLDLDPN